MISIRVTSWHKTSIELMWLVDWFVKIRGISARIWKSDKKFAVYREMDLEMAERLGWIEDGRSSSYGNTARGARRNAVESGNWRKG